MGGAHLRTRHPHLGPRHAQVLTSITVAVVLCGFALFGLGNMLFSPHSGWMITLNLVFTVAMVVLQLGYFSRPSARVRPPGSYLMLALQAALVYLPLLLFGQAWIDMPGFLAGSVLLALPFPASWLAFGAIVASVGFIQPVLDDSPVQLLYSPLGTVITGLVVYGLTRLAVVVVELNATRTGLAKAAVAEERLRLARDLHDLLGLSLSAVTLKGELTHRLLVKHPDRADAELADVLTLSRRALADVRSIASGYRELSLDEEVRSALSVVKAANVEVRLDFRHGGLPAQVVTVLATVLREGVTNMLRHSKVEHCEISVVEDAGTVSLVVLNDGLDGDDQAGGTGNGLDNLSVRVSGIGGELRSGVEDDDRFALRARVPLDEARRRRRGRTVRPLGEPGEPASHDVAGEPDRLRGDLRSSQRMARVFVGVVFVAMACAATVRVLFLPDTFLVTVLTVGAMAALVAIQLQYLFRPVGSSTVVYGTLAVQAALVYVPVALVDSWVSLPGFLAGSALLVLRPLPAWTAFAAVMGTVVWYSAAHGAGAMGVGFGLVSAINTSLVVFGLTWLVNLVLELQEARTELARAAVRNQRLTFSRDLDELLGVSLSAIIRKAERARELSRTDVDRAAEELVSALELSRRALTDVRAIASGYGRLSFEDEAASAMSTLRAADVRVRANLRHDSLPPEVGTVLASVLREGVTNMLRHSRVTRCEITTAATDGVVSLDIVNDGALAAGDRAPRQGAGLCGVACQVDGLGGELTAGSAGHGRYRLHVTIGVAR